MPSQASLGRALNLEEVEPRSGDRLEGSLELPPLEPFSHRFLPRSELITCGSLSRLKGGQPLALFAANGILQIDGMAGATSAERLAAERLAAGQVAAKSLKPGDEIIYLWEGSQSNFYEVIRLSPR